MGKIQGWKKYNDITWRHEVTNAQVQIVPTKRTVRDVNKMKYVEVRAYDVYVESRNPPKHPRVRIPQIKTKELATKNAMSWMRRHPNG